MKTIFSARYQCVKAELAMLYSKSATIVPSLNRTTLSISGFHCLVASLCMLSGCHSAFPSDLVLINNIQEGWQHLSMSTEEQVPSRHGRAAESLSHIHNSTWKESQWTVTHFYLWHCHGIDVFGHQFYWCNIEVKTENTDLLQSFSAWIWRPHLHHRWWNNWLF